MPAAGTLAAVNRGERRALQSVVVELSESERAGEPADADCQIFEAYTGKTAGDLTGEQVRALLLESGLWTALRGRPFGRVADPQVSPHSVFVTAMDTNPLAASVDAVLAGNETAFEAGLICVSKLTEGKTFLCRAPESAVTAPEVPGEKRPSRILLAWNCIGILAMVLMACGLLYFHFIH